MLERGCGHFKTSVPNILRHGPRSGIGAGDAYNKDDDDQVIFWGVGRLFYLCGPKQNGPRPGTRQKPCFWGHFF